MPLRTTLSGTSYIRNLSIAAGSSTSPSLTADPEWEVIEEECAPYPTLAADLARRSIVRGIEDGPLPTPPACLDLARRRLTSVSVGPDRRAHRPFKAGFWSAASIQTSTPYQPEEDLPDLKMSDWVVLKSSRTPPAFRVTSRRACVALTEGDTDLVVEKFARSIAWGLRLPFLPYYDAESRCEVCIKG